MQQFEYKVVPAPRRGEKQRGVKTTEDRFALALMSKMNELGAEGWEYLRAESLPCDERSGFTGTKTTQQHILVFRRAILPLEEPKVRVGAAKKTTKSAAPAVGPAIAQEQV